MHQVFTGITNAVPVIVELIGVRLVDAVIVAVESVAASTGGIGAKGVIQDTVLIGIVFAGVAGVVAVRVELVGIGFGRAIVITVRQCRAVFAAIG